METNPARKALFRLDPGGKRILIAHQDNPHRLLLKRLLKQPDYRTATVNCGADAINRLSRGRFDLLLTALQLPDTDSWRLIKMVRSGDFCNATLPIIVLADDLLTSLLAPLAQEYGATLLPLGQLTQLTTVVTDCLNDQVKPTVLVIEDDKVFAEWVASSLSTSYQVDLAFDGETGLAVWKVGRHPLVLLDLRLPDLSGEAVLKEMLAIDPAQPIVIITAHGSPERHQALVLAGARAFIHKPSDDIKHLRTLCDTTLRCRSYLDECSALAREEQIKDEVRHRVWMAHQCLITGQNAMVDYHLKQAQALVNKDKAPPTDDDLASLQP